jgi:hypothetical protein
MLPLPFCATPRANWFIESRNNGHLTIPSNQLACPRSSSLRACRLSAYLWKLAWVWVWELLPVQLPPILYVKSSAKIRFSNGIRFSNDISCVRRRHMRRVSSLRDNCSLVPAAMAGHYGGISGRMSSA